MTTIDTQQLAEKLAGGDSYIRTKKGEVKGLAITTEKNPEAPDVIVVGKGPIIQKNAVLFVESGKYVPVYVKQCTNKWKYFGEYKADSFVKDLEVIEKHRKHRRLDDVSGILFLSPQDDVEVSISLSRSVLDKETKKKIELTAINCAITYFESHGFTVTDRQSENCGYDLLIESDRTTLKVEVKGTAGEEQRFFLSRNEKRCSVDPLWRLAIVSNVLIEPQLEIFNTETMERKFDFEPLCWECNMPKTTSDHETEPILAV